MKHKTLMDAQLSAYPDSRRLTDDEMLGLLENAMPAWTEQAIKELVTKYANKEIGKSEMYVERERQRFAVAESRGQWARIAFMCRTTYPDGFFYACGRRDDGVYKFVGFRYGLEESEYMSGFCDMTFMGTDVPIRRTTK